MTETKKNIVDDMLDAVSGSTPTHKRPRAGASNPYTPGSSTKPSTPKSTSHRPLATGPSRLGSSPRFPADSQSSPASSSTIPSIPFLLRPNPFTLQETLNGHIPLPTSEQSRGTAMRTKLFSTTNPADYNYRYMYEKMMERSEGELRSCTEDIVFAKELINIAPCSRQTALDKMIDEAAETLRQHYGIDEYGDPSVQSQEDIIAVGRLCPETESVKMTETSTWLESSRVLGSGQRVMLKFEHDMKVRGAPNGSGGMGMFPGCLVGVKGRNGGGKLFSVSEVLMLPPIDPTYTRPSELLQYQHGPNDIRQKQLDGAPLAAFVAAGPYTVDSDLDYAPLGALLEQVEREKPDVLVLLGPFIDADHPLIKSGDVDETPNQIFRNQISARLASLILASPRTTVILVPNARDLTSLHIAYPQSPLVKEPELGLPKGVKLLPNPTTFSVNEIVFSITSLDVLFHLRNQEFFRKCGEILPEGEVPDTDLAAKDMMARTCRHLLRQRSFYPLFPAPMPGKGIDAINLDITHNDLVKMGTNGADIVILPSLLKHFSKLVDSVVFVNPSFLTKGNSAGTFARLTIKPMDKDALLDRIEGRGVDEEPDEPVEHRVYERCRVDIIKV
ncbi:DNA polymerase alpha subunit B, partial [Phenoliferia sp. Uapishka_3]